MSNSYVLPGKVVRINSYLYNLIAVVLIYLIPTISHLLSLPVYLIDPMRIVILLSVIHTSNKNAYLIALTLPLFSFLIASHPVALKSLLITSELVLNIWLFFAIYNRVTNKFAAMFLSIILSKIYYYIVKSCLVSNGFLSGDIISTPVLLQLLTALVIRIYFYLISKPRANTGK